MVKIVLTPEWFIGKDIMIEVFSVIVLMIFVILAYKYYKVNHKRKIFYLFGIYVKYGFFWIERYI